MKIDVYMSIKNIFSYNLCPVNHSYNMSKLFIQKKMVINIQFENIFLVGILFFYSSFSLYNFKYNMYVCI